MNKQFAKLKTSFSKFAKDNAGVVAFLIAVYAITLFPLFRANFNYRDDGGRVLWAYDGWNSFGRVTSNTLSHIIHADQYLRDISPLTQILAVMLIVITSMLLLKVVRENRKISIWDAVCVLPLGLFPYFLCCFSYKFDAPYMALSVLVSIIPLTIRKRGWSYYLSAFICTILMCTTYQASAGIFPMLVVYTAFQDWKDGEKTKETIRYCLLSALVYLVALFLFFLLVPKGNSEYVAEKTSLSQLSIRHIIENYWIYIMTFKKDFRIHWFAIIVLISALFLFVNTIDTCRKKGWTFLLAGVTYVLIFLFAFGPYPFLAEPFLMPRGMYGLCMFISLVCLGAIPRCRETGKTNQIIKAVSLISVVSLSWMCVVFSCTYGNALAAQQKFDEFRIQEVATQLAELPSIQQKGPVQIQVRGSIGYAAGIKDIPGDRVLLRLIPPPFGGENRWSYLKLLSYYGLPELVDSGELVFDDYSSWEIAHENCYHVIYTNNNKIVVELNNS